MSQKQTKNNFIKLLSLAVSFLFFFSINAVASIAQATRTYPTDICNLNCDSDETIRQNLIQNFSEVAKAPKSKGAYDEIVSAETIVPGDVSTTFNKMADKSVKYFWENSEIKKTSVGRSVEIAQKSLQKDVTIKSGRTEQKINFSIDAFQSAARIKYSGYTNAEVSYETRDSSVGVKMFNKISQNTNLELGEIIKPNDQVSQVVIKWNW